MQHDLHKVLAEEVSLLVGEGVQHDLHKVLAEEVSHSASGEGCSMTFTKCWLRR